MENFGEVSRNLTVNCLCIAQIQVLASCCNTKYNKWGTDICIAVDLNIVLEISNVSSFPLQKILENDIPQCHQVFLILVGNAVRLK